MAKSSRLLALGVIPVVAGCSSIIEGTSQTISIDSSPTGARCEFEREGQIVGVVDPTPGSIFLKKTKNNINLTCEKAGYEEARAFIKSEVEGATFGNIILGGGIGWIIDSASGADNKYQDHLSVTLTPLQNTQEQPETETVATAPPAPRSSPIWRTRDESVEGFAGARGTGGSVLIPPSVELRLTRVDEKWGNFTYESVEGRPANVWILLEKVVRG